MDSKNAFSDDLVRGRHDERDSRFNGSARDSIAPFRFDNSRKTSIRRSDNLALRKASMVTRQRLVIAIIVCCSFVVGIAVGILIGVYAIYPSQNDNPTPNEPHSTLGLRGLPDKTETVLTSTASSVNPAGITTPIVTQSQQSSPSSLTSKSTVVTSNEGEIVMSPFAPLTVTEYKHVKEYMTLNKLAGTSELRIRYLHLNPPDKKSALRYIDEGGPFPGRFAKVSVLRSSASILDVMEYKIGPLNSSMSDMKATKLLKDGEIHYNRRPYDRSNTFDMYNIVKYHFAPLKTLLSESFDGIYIGNRAYVLFATIPSESIDDRVSSVLLTYSGMGSQTVRVLPVTCIIHHPGTNISAWYASDFYYFNQGPFSSGQDLSEAYRKDALRKVALPSGYLTKYRNRYALKRNASLPLRDGSETPPPRTYEPQGPRYSIKGHKVKWMGWSFEFTSDVIRGPALYDIRFRGDRIAYEISLQDITLIYASGTSGAGLTPAVLSDTEYEIGEPRGIRLGLDCPERASFISATTSKGKSTPSACVFEVDGQEAIWRHKGTYTTGLLNHFLVVRVPMNLGNYDYTMQFKFFLDGHLSTTVTASGYLYTSFWDSNHPVYGNATDTPFGFRVGDLLVGSIHDHSFLFKVDLDVIDTNNSFQVVRWKSGDVKTALNTQGTVTQRPSYFPFDVTRYLQYETVTRETGVVLDSLNPAIWAVVNENKRNAHGVKRGYRITPLTSSAETLAPEHPYFGPWPHLKYHCAITKYKPNELYGTNSIYDIVQPTRPTGGIDKMMIDKDVIQNEDLVAWVTSKFMHAPTSEDMPMTMGVEKGFSLNPFNFFDSSPTFDLNAHYTSSDPYPAQPCNVPAG